MTNEEISTLARRRLATEIGDLTVRLVEASVHIEALQGEVTHLTTLMPKDDEKAKK